MDVRAENSGRPPHKVIFPADLLMGRNCVTPSHPGARVRNVNSGSIQAYPNTLTPLNPRCIFHSLPPSLSVFLLFVWAHVLRRAFRHRGGSKL